ncbi:MAG: terpene cyclase/mutase family protein [Planctomycetes bacterium]|nr:terpene cyclase/mutase family protein [Planctomycetota bacterium]
MHWSRLLPCWLSLAVAVAQTPPQLPTLYRLGPVPADAVHLQVQAAGAVQQADGTGLAGENLAGALPTGTAHLVLAVDRGAPVSAVQQLLEFAAGRGVTEVHFAAQLPDGTRGAFALALPEPQAATGWTMRMHRGRPGVPTASAQPFLQRMQRGLPDAALPQFALAVEVPADAAWSDALGGLATAAAAGVERVVLRTTPAQPGATKGPLAIDLGTQPWLAVPAAAIPLPKPALASEPVGCRSRATAPPADDAGEVAGGGAGGRYAGRAGAAGRGRGAAYAAAIAAGLNWLGQRMDAEGALRDAQGRPDVGATALLQLAILGNGTTLRSGPHREMLQRSVGWLMAQQAEDGSFADRVPDHALATYAVVEAFGLSAAPLVRGAAQDGLDRLCRWRERDGGFAAAPGTPSDTATTTLALVALASAQFFALRADLAAADAAGFYEGVATPDGRHRPNSTAPETAPLDAVATGAALFGRFFAGQDSKRDPRTTAAADLLLAGAQPAEPWTCYWTTYALFQLGGRHWAAWTKRLDAEVLTGAVAQGAAAGSWPAAGGLSAECTTALRVLTLESYYRYTRLVR